MRKVLLFALFLVSAVSFSQAPQFLNYQAIARNASGVIVTNPIGIQFEIIQGSVSGTVVYEETNNITPSSAGVFTAAIGNGSPVIGNFPTINWANGPYFIRVSIDPSGGTSYSTVGTSQLLSVPYALYAETTKPSTLSISGNSLSINNGNSVTLPAGTSYTPGTGISISGGTITNIAPDPTLTPSGITSISGANPSFTIDVPPPSMNYNTGTQELTLTQGTVVTTATITTSSTSVNITGSGVSGSYPNYTITPTPATSITSTGSSILVNGTGPGYTIVPQPSLTVAGNQLSITDGNTVTLPTGTTYTNGAGIAFTSGTVITNTAMDQTVVISNGINTNVSGTYPFFTIDATPSLSIGSGSISISGGNSVALPTAPPPTTVIAGTNVSVGGTGPTYTVNATPSLSIGSGSISISGGNSVALPTAPPPTTVIAGTNVSVGGTGPTYTVNATPSLSISGNTLSITGGTPVTLPIPPPLTASTGISINSGTITNTAPDVPVTLLGVGATTIGGTYPNFTIGTPPPSPVVITGQGTSSVTTAGNNFTVTTPAVNMSYVPATGILSYSPSAVSNTINISPNVSFSGSTLTVGSNSTVIAGSNLWARSSTTATTLFNPNDYVGIGLNNPTKPIHLFQTGSGNAATLLLEAATVDASTNSGLILKNGTNTVDMWHDAFSSKLFTNIPAGYTANWRVASVDRMTLASNGFLGLGTTTPAQLMHLFSSGTNVGLAIDGGVAGRARLGFLPGGVDNGEIGFKNHLVFGSITNTSLGMATEFMRLTSSGNLGIGTASPLYGLHVVKNTATYIAGFENNSAAGQGIELRTAGSSSSSTALDIVTGGVNRFFVRQDGWVSIGVASPGNLTTKLGLDGSNASTVLNAFSGSPETSIRIHNSDLTNNNFSSLIFSTQNTSAGSHEAAKIAAVNTNHTSGSIAGDLVFMTRQPSNILERMRITSNGNVGIGTSAPVNKLHVAGGVTIVDGTEGAGKVFTSDATGNGTWQTPAVTPKVGFFAGNQATTGQTIPASTTQTIVMTAGPRFFNDGGGYNTGNGVFTAPSAGLYQINVEMQYTSTAGAVVQFVVSSPSNTFGQWIQYAGANGQGHASFNLNVRLSAGETFYVTGFSSASMTIDRWHSSFSGHLVYQ